MTSHPARAAMTSHVIEASMPLAVEALERLDTHTRALRAARKVIASAGPVGHLAGAARDVVSQAERAVTKATKVLWEYVVPADGLGPVYSRSELVFRAVRMVVAVDMAMLTRPAVAAYDGEESRWLPCLDDVRRYVESELARIDRLWQPFADGPRGHRLAAIAEAHAALRRMGHPELIEWLACRARSSGSRLVREASARVLWALAVNVESNDVAELAPCESSGRT
jgi:hypothetical protein